MTQTAQRGVFSYALQPVKYSDGNVVARAAKSRFTLVTNPANGNTITIGATVYTFKTALSVSPTADEVLIGATPTATAANLAAAVNASAGAGTTYGTGTTANATWAAVAAYTTLFLVALAAGSAANTSAVSTASSHITIVAAPSGGQDAGVFNTDALSYDRHRSYDINYEASQNQQLFPNEIGTTDMPVGSFKSAVAIAGGATLTPRLEGNFGDILMAMAGSCVTQANTPESGVNTHTFSLKPDGSLPWVAARKHIPGDNVVRAKGLVGYDNKLASLRLMLPQAGLVQGRVDFLGRVPKFENYPEAWLYSGEFENSPSVPISNKGYFKIPAVNSGEQPITGMVMEMTNILSTPQEEGIVGSFFPDDIIVKSRVLTLRFTLKWNDPEMYERIFTGQVNGTDWSSDPFETVKSGSDWAFEARTESPANIPTKGVPYSLTVHGGRVSWQVASEVRMSAGRILEQDYVGTVLVPLDSTVPYMEFILVNSHSGYTIPVQT